MYGLNGKSAADHVDKLTFRRTVDTGEVTTKAKYGAWDPEVETFPSVKSPEVAGCEADQESIAEYGNITEDSKDIIDTVKFYRQESPETPGHNTSRTLSSDSSVCR